LFVAVYATAHHHTAEVYNVHVMLHMFRSRIPSNNSLTCMVILQLVFHTQVMMTSSTYASILFITALHDVMTSTC